MTEKEFLTSIRLLPCIACNKYGDTCVHHIKTRGSGGKNDPWNLLPLCNDCHTMGPTAWHRGYKIFLEEYPHVWEYMEKMGWEILNGKLFNDRN